MSQAVTDSTAAGSSAGPPEGLDTRAILKLGLGGFASPAGALWLAVCGMLVFHGIQRLQYALKSEPLVLEAADLDLAGHNDFVRITGRLEAERRHEFAGPADERFALTPLAGTGGRLLVYRRVAAQPAGPDAASTPETFTGRIVAADWSGSWDLAGRTVDVAAELGKHDLVVPGSALVLLADELPQLEPWPVAIGAAGLAVWLWFGWRAIHTARLLRCRERASAELEMLDESDDDDELQSLRARRVGAA